MSTLPSHGPRVSTAADDQAFAATRRANARKNLATRVCRDWRIDPAPGAQNHPDMVRAAARDFERLAEILGLADIHHVPGTCRGCGAAMPMSNATSAGTSRHEVLCIACRKAASGGQP